MMSWYIASEPLKWCFHGLQLSGCKVSNLVWAYATLDVCHEELFAVFANYTVALHSQWGHKHIEESNLGEDGCLECTGTKEQQIDSFSQAS